MYDAIYAQGSLGWYAIVRQNGHPIQMGEGQGYDFMLAYNDARRMIERWQSADHMVMQSHREYLAHLMGA